MKRAIEKAAYMRTAGFEMFYTYKKPAGLTCGFCLFNFCN